MQTTLTPPASTAGKQAAVAERIGAAATVEALPFDLAALDQEGLFVNVDTTGSRILDRRLDWRDIGVELPPGKDVAIRQPQCGLLPRRYRQALLRPYGQAHRALHDHSFRFTVCETVFESPAYRWVPWTAWTAFETAWAGAQAHLARAKEDVLAAYPAIRAEMEDVFRAVAVDAAIRLSATTGKPVGGAFVDAFVAAYLGAMPTRERIEAEMTLSYTVGVLMLGSEMWAEAAAAAKARADVTVAAASVAAAADEASREAAVKERIRQLKLEAARERLDEMVSPLTEGARQLQAAVHEAAVAIRDSLARHGHLHGPTADRAREIAGWFRLMNWTGDAELERLLTELERLANQPRSGVPLDVTGTQGVLREIVTRTYAAAVAVAPSRMSALEI